MLSRDIARLPKVVRDFRPNCPGCTPEKVTTPGGEPCSFYSCPGLPDQLKVTCDLCMFDFANQNGQFKCDHTTCETAIRLKKNVATYRGWVQMIAEEMEAAAQSRKLTN